MLSVCCMSCVHGLKNQCFPLVCVSVFVVWFLWNNLIKVPGSDWKLDYICLSHSLWSPFPTQQRSFQESRVFSSSFHYLKGESTKNCHYLITFTITPVAVRKYSLITIKKGKNVIVWSDFDLAAPRRRFKRRLKDLISFTAAFKGVFHLRDFLT